MSTQISLIQDMITRKIPFSFDGEDIRVDGFSKSGDALLEWRGDVWIAHTRYSSVAQITNADDILNLAYFWYKNSGRDYLLPPLLQHREKYLPLKGESPSGLV